MALYYAQQYAITKLSVSGGIDNSQTTGIVIQSTTGIDTTKAGILCIGWSDPLVDGSYEYVSYTSINGSKELQGVTRGAEGSTAITHDNLVDVAWVLTESHINNINDKLTGADTDGVQLVEINDTNGNEQIKFTTTASAVNEFTVTNAATGNSPTLEATGGDTNVDIILKPKGTGKPKYNNGTNTVSLVPTVLYNGNRTGGNITVSSITSAYADIGNEWTTTQTTTGGLLLINVMISLAPNVGSYPQTTRVKLLIDSSDYFLGFLGQTGNINLGAGYSLFVPSLSAGSHTFKVQVGYNGTGSIVVIGDASTGARLQIVEYPA